MNEHFASATTAVPDLFKILMASDVFVKKGSVDQKGKAGIYIFFEGGQAVHVGRTRNLGGRLRGHTLKSHYSASFAFKRTRRALGKLATYKSLGSRAHLSTDEIFQPEFHRQIELVKQMEVRFLEVSDPVLQYLLELYACLELGLPLDEFDTH